MLRKVLFALFALLLIIQLFRPEKNDSNDATYEISKKYLVPDDVAVCDEDVASELLFEPSGRNSLDHWVDHRHKRRGLKGLAPNLQFTDSSKEVSVP